MAVESTHPRYADMHLEWTKLRDFARGERVVKSKGEDYLPATKGMKLDGMGSSPNSHKSRLGQEVYDSYLLRAVFPEYIMDALEIFMGMLHNKSPVIELPPEMESLREMATELGEPLELLLQRVNLEQLTTGRVGLLLDMPKNPDPRNPLPFIALYIAEAIRNWDNDVIGDERADLQLVVLDESGFIRGDQFQWIAQRKFRVLELGFDTDAEGETTSRTYRTGAFATFEASTQYDPEEMRAPMFRGATLDSIPFVFVNSKDINPDPMEPPLIGLARLCEAVYRGEADYRQNLFMQGQDTLVVIGERAKPLLAPGVEEEPLRTGAGSRIDLESRVRDFQSNAWHLRTIASVLSRGRDS
jgi:hypothetical protein